MPIVLKFGSLNLLEASGPVQAYTGVALPLHVMTFLFVTFLWLFCAKRTAQSLVGQPEGKRGWEDIDVDLYTSLLPKSRVLRASTHAV